MKKQSLLLSILISSGFFSHAYAQGQIIEFEYKDHSQPIIIQPNNNEIDLVKSSDEEDVLFVQNENHYVNNLNTWMRLVQSRGIDYQEIQDKLDQGQNVNQVIMDGNTMLILASMQNNMIKAKLALDYNANTHIQNKSGELALHWASSTGNLELVKLLLSSGANNVKPVKKNANPEVEDINKQTKSGRTPLHFASLYRSNPQIIEYLINNKADVNLIDIKGQTAAHFATSSREWDNLEMLMKKGANIFIKDKNGVSVEDMILENADTPNMIRFYKFLSAEGKMAIKTKLNNFNINFDNPETFIKHPASKDLVIIPPSTKSIIPKNTNPANLRPY